MGGSSIIWHRSCWWRSQVRVSCPFGVRDGGTRRTGTVVAGTLLGPEGSGASLLSVRAPPVSVPSRAPLEVGRRGRVVGYRPYVENYTVDASIFVNQVFKGARWMPWHQEPKKDVGICDKPRGVDNQTVIRGFPNGETRLE